MQQNPRDNNNIINLRRKGQRCLQNRNDKNQEIIDNNTNIKY